jgi:hypothetical protein
MGKLSELDNFDKHNLLVVTAVRPGAIGITLPLGRGIKFVAAVAPPPGSRVPDFRLSARGGDESLFLEHGDVIGRFTSTNEAAEKAYPYFAPLIAFREPGVVEREPVLAFLTQTTRLVEHVVDLFASYFGVVHSGPQVTPPPTGSPPV